MQQVTWFELEAEEKTDCDINDLSEPEMVDIVGCSAGLNFKYKNELFGYEAKTKHCTFTLKYSTYKYAGAYGKRHISAGYDYKKNGEIGGAGRPCDSIQQAIDFMKRGIERWA